MCSAKQRMESHTPCRSCLVQTAEMQKALDGLKGAVAALEQGGAKSGASDGQALTVKELRSELRTLASSLNECAALPLRFNRGCRARHAHACAGDTS